jgi:hypothetical protein
LGKVIIELEGITLIKVTPVFSAIKSTTKDFFLHIISAVFGADIVTSEISLTVVTPIFGILKTENYKLVPYNSTFLLQLAPNTIILTPMSLWEFKLVDPGFVLIQNTATFNIETNND